VVTVNEVVALAAEIRRGTPPSQFREACDVVENATHGVSSGSAEFDDARHAFMEHLGRDSNAEFELWALAAMNGMADLRLHLAQTNRDEPPAWLLHTVSQLRDGTADWVRRIQVILQSESWRNWTQNKS
jgi:hypothetical protein